MANKKDTEKAYARLKFLYDGDSYKKIAQELGVNEVTVGKWAKEGMWEHEKKLMRLSPETAANKLTAYLNNYFEAIDNREQGAGLPTSSEMDAISKIIAGKDRIMKAVSPDNIYKALRKFFSYVETENLGVAQSVVVYLEPFMKEIIEQYEKDIQ